MGVQGVSNDGFRREIETVINRHSKENGSDTPDFILAEYLHHCLVVFDQTVRQRDAWYGITTRFGRLVEVETPDGVV